MIAAPGDPVALVGAWAGFALVLLLLVVVLILVLLALRSRGRRVAGDPPEAPSTPDPWHEAARRLGSDPPGTGERTDDGRGP